MTNRILMSTTRQDRAVRAMAEDGSFRVICVRATDTVTAAMKAQGVEGESAKLFGELMIGSALVRETMSPEQRLQMVIGSHGSVAADSHPGGMTRGLVRPAEDGSVAVFSNARMQVIRAMYDGSLHHGIVEVFPDKGISEAIHQYLKRSEQVDSFVEVYCVLGQDQVLAAGGYIVQRLPEAGDVDFDKMAARIEEMGSVSAEMVFRDSDPTWVLHALMEDIPFVTLEAPEVFFGCNCGEEKILTSLATLGREELQSIMDDGKSIETSCDYCHTEYDIGLEKIKTLLVVQ